MKNIYSLALFVLLFFSCLFGKTVDLDEYSYPFNVIDIKGDSGDVVIKKSTKVLPTKRQMDYHKLEYTAFIHFGINTFTGKEWGNGMENPEDFNPPSVNTDQWCKVAKESGMKLIMMTVKHHDGFCLWQTRYNDQFSVKKSPWKNGKGDVLRQLTESAKKYGLKVGVYVSPSDLYQMESKEGVYGNLSPAVTSIIPTDPKSFASNPLVSRKVDKNLPKFKIKVDDYNRYFMNQLYEVLTEYGPIHEVWFDGAHPKRKGNQQYVKDKWFTMIRELAPQAAIFGGPDVRWVGNEHGGTRKNEWNVLPIENIKVSGIDRAPYTLTFGEERDLNRGFYKVYGKRYENNYLKYIIAEVDVSIRHGWFWRNEYEQTVRSAENIFDMYERSVGGNTVFLLNIPPNNQGVFAKRDVESLLKAGEYIKNTYGNDLFKDSKVSMLSLRDKNIETFQLIKDFEDQKIEIKLPKKVKMNRFQVQEAISKIGQRVAKHKVEVFVNNKWKTVSTAGVIGYKRIHRFKTVFSDRFRLVILDSRSKSPVGISEVAGFFFKKPVKVDLKISRNGDVSLNPSRNFNEYKNSKIYWTIDGSIPNENSTIYKNEISLPNGGTLSYRTYLDGEWGRVEKKILPISSENWAISGSSCKRKNRIRKALDFRKNTYWETKSGKKYPHYLQIDFSKKTQISGFSYLPYTSKNREKFKSGLIKNWEVYTSNDGEKWKKIASGEYGNIINDPSERSYFFEKEIKVRFLKFVPTQGIENSNTLKVAEFKVFSVNPKK